MHFALSLIFISKSLLLQFVSVIKLLFVVNKVDDEVSIDIFVLFVKLEFNSFEFNNISLISLHPSFKWIILSKLDIINSIKWSQYCGLFIINEAKPEPKTSIKNSNKKVDRSYGAKSLHENSTTSASSAQKNILIANTNYGLHQQEDKKKKMMKTDFFQD